MGWLEIPGVSQVEKGKQLLKPHCVDEKYRWPPRKYNNPASLRSTLVTPASPTSLQLTYRVVPTKHPRVYYFIRDVNLAPAETKAGCWSNLYTLSKTLDVWHEAYQVLLYSYSFTLGPCSQQCHSSSLQPLLFAAVSGLEEVGTCQNVSLRTAYTASDGCL